MILTKAALSSVVDSQTKTDRNVLYLAGEMINLEVMGIFTSINLSPSGLEKLLLPKELIFQT